MEGHALRTLRFYLSGPGVSGPHIPGPLVYSNIGYALEGEVAAAASGNTCDTWSRQRRGGLIQPRRTSQLASICRSVQTAVWNRSRYRAIG
jgi:hypothetical protein